MKPTHEQVACIDAFQRGDNLKINAFAGTGKTTTLKGLSVSDKGRQSGLYVAFNKAIAVEAASKFPSAVTCKTAHSLAYHAVGKHYRHRLTRFTHHHIISLLDLNSKHHMLSAGAMAFAVLDTVNRFCQSELPRITLECVPARSVDEFNNPDNQLQAGLQIIKCAQNVWQAMKDKRQTFPITHDVYLKLWQLTKPSLQSDYILFDEAQDASPVMLDVIQSQKDSQIICVGDPYQQIYSWRGAVNAMEQIKTDSTCTLSQSFRFGEEIADVANCILQTQLNADVELKGTPTIKSHVGKVTDPKCLLFRTNMALIERIVHELERGKKVSVVGGTQGVISLVNGAEALQDGRRTKVPELSMFKTWDSVVEMSETDAGKDLQVLVNIMDKYKSDKIVGFLKKTEDDESTADIVVSTGHKAKGREWESVWLASDFKDKSSEYYTPEESNLLYVAATRAINNLDVTDCKAAGWT